MSRRICALFEAKGLSIQVSVLIIRQSIARKRTFKRQWRDCHVRCFLHACASDAHSRETVHLLRESCAIPLGK